MRWWAAALVPLAGCHQAPQVAETPGGRLEAAAVARGLIPDADQVGVTGVWTGDTDRLCIVPAGLGFELGASVDYGDGQGCAASGTVVRSGGTLRVELGDCRFQAAFDGERIVFPAEVPAGCARFCSGRASLSALTVERLSESVSEAASLRGANGRALCTG